MDESESNVVELPVDWTRATRDVAESLRLMRVFMTFSAARRSEILGALEREALKSSPKDCP